MRSRKQKISGAPPEIEYSEDLAAFISAAPTSFHAAREVARRLDAAGFTPQDESEDWDGSVGGHYLVRDGAVVAWRIPEGKPSAFRIVGSHTDSPSFKVKPSATSTHFGFSQINVETYGGLLANSWLNRELGLAGRIVTLDGSEHLVTTGPLMMIPQLAPHLDRSVREKLTLNPQKHLHPVWALDGASQAGSLGDINGSAHLARQSQELAQSQEPAQRDFAHEFTNVLVNSIDTTEHIEPAGRGRGGDSSPSSSINPEHIAGADLFAYDCQTPEIMNGTFLAAGRQDNLVSVHASLRALIAADSPEIAVMAAFDHEEVGSQTAAGASGPLLETTLQRIAIAAGRTQDQIYQMFARSSCVSSDAGHSVNPNYAEFHDPDQFPVMGRGPMIKINANQRYASDGRGQALWLRACHEAGEPTQEFVSNNAVSCGSTIGPLTATRLGIATVDVGVPLLSMHSVRELSAVRDDHALSNIMKGYWNLA
ncbi:MAG: M18 family aminopeptidase [Ancrocorticia sp.]|uniref:M18 family aminopeptidase n=1 Tax=Ancrocorticia sp. TaxID=2593684 RepID=UPI003F91A073